MKPGFLCGILLVACQCADKPPAAGGGLEAPATGVSQVVYDRGSARPRIVVVDETHLYWSESSADGLQVVKAPKDGSGPVTVLGPWSGWDVGGQLIALDETHVYWRYDELINKVPKAGDELEQLPLGMTDPGGPLVADADRLYAASPNCSTIARIDKVSGNPQLTQVPDSPEFRGGDTRLFLQGDYLYCGSGARILRMPRVNGAIEEVVVLESQEHRVGQFAIVGDYAYWSHDLTTLGTGGEKLVRAKIPDGALEELLDLGGGGTVHFDSAAQILYAMGSQKALPVWAYSTRTGESAVLAERQYLESALTGDREYLYWTRNDRGDAGEALLGVETGNDIVRLSKQLPCP